MNHNHRDTVKFASKHFFGKKKRKKMPKSMKMKKKQANTSTFTGLMLQNEAIQPMTHSDSALPQSQMELINDGASTSRDFPSSNFCEENTSSGEIKNSPFSFVRDESASKFKLSLFKKSDVCLKNKIEKKGFSLICLKSLDSFISELACPICLNKTITLIEDAKKRKGSAQHLSAHCSTCKDTVSSFMTSPRTYGQSSKNPFEINTRLVTAAKNIGLGYTGLSEFCSGINLPIPMHLKTFQNHQSKVHDGSIAACHDNFQKVAKIIKKTYKDIFPANNKKEIIDIVVSFDGTWMKRGHTSHFGVGIVIELLTGLVIDFAVLSNYCHGCAIGPKPDNALYEQWKENHKCYQNTNVSSGSMEPESAKLLWGRSVSRYGLRYTTILSDGDSKTFKSLCDSEFPGYENCTLKKEECVNHVEKRMGTALRGIVSEYKSKKTPISGRGRLTKEVIDHLTRYYGWAIKDHSGDLEGMYNAVWATLFHISSTDNDPVHHRCPDGPESWCFFNKALALKETPRNHKPLLTKEVSKELIPIYTRLSDYDLLSRCMEGKTQNANESLNACIWKKCLKISFASLPTVETAVSLAVTSFNKGSQYLVDLYNQLKIKESEYTNLAATKKDARRIFDAERRSSKAFKRKRVHLRILEKRKEDKQEEQEGIAYASGTF